MDGLRNLINCYYHYRYYAEGRSVTPEETSLVLVIYSDVGLMAVPVTGAYRVQVVPVPPQNGVATQTGEMQPVLETVSTSSRPELAVWNYYSDAA